MTHNSSRTVSLRPFAASLIAFATFVALRWVFDLADGAPLLLAGALCFLAAATLSLLRTGPAWRVGLWASSAFWAFLLLVAALQLSTGAEAWKPAAEALWLFVAAWGGAAVVLRSPWGPMLRDASPRG